MTKQVQSKHGEFAARHTNVWPVAVGIDGTAGCVAATVERDRATVTGVLRHLLS
jgi:hypothetical protein